MHVSFISNLLKSEVAGHQTPANTPPVPSSVYDVYAWLFFFCCLLCAASLLCFTQTCDNGLGIRKASDNPPISTAAESTDMTASEMTAVYICIASSRARRRLWGRACASVTVCNHRLICGSHRSPRRSAITFGDRNAETTCLNLNLIRHFSICSSDGCCWICASL